MGILASVHGLCWVSLEDPNKLNPKVQREAGKG